MKVRAGFVSNSSSASFVVQKSNLNEMQLCMIRNHIEGAKMFDRCVEYFSNEDNQFMSPSALFGWYDEWRIEEDDETITVSADMDNFDMEAYLQRIDVCLSDMQSWHS